jgi:cell division protease FtsH
VARAMVHDYAMGTPGTPQSAVHESDGHSEQFRRVRDEEQQALAYEAQRAARELINGQRKKLEELARALLEREVLEREDIDAIMKGVPRMERRAGVSGLRVVASAAVDDGEDDPDASSRGRSSSKPSPVPGV